MIVRFADEAMEDLSSIRAFLSDVSPRAAERIGRQLVEAADSLADFPNRGRPGLVPGTRESIAVSPHVIVYRVGSEAVDVLRVWREAQDRSAS